MNINSDVMQPSKAEVDKQVEDACPDAAPVSEDFLEKTFGLTYKQSTVLLLLAHGKTARQAATEVGIHFNSISRWRKDDTIFRMAEDYLRKAAMHEALAAIEYGVPEAINEVARLLTKSKSENIRLQAARLLIQIGIPT